MEPKRKPQRGELDPVLPMALLGVLGIVAAIVYSLAVSVDEYEWYVKQWSNQVVEVGHGPEILFEIPGLLSVFTLDDRDQTVVSDPMEVLLADRRTETVWFVVEWRIRDVERFFDEAGEVRRANSRVNAVGTLELKNWFGRTTAVDNAQAEAYLMKGLRAYAENWGMEILKTQVMRLDNGETK